MSLYLLFTVNSIFILILTKKIIGFGKVICFINVVSYITDVISVDL